MYQSITKWCYIQLLKNNGKSFTDVTSLKLTNYTSKLANWINWIRIMDNDGDLDITTDDKMYNLVWTNNNGSFTGK